MVQTFFQHGVILRYQRSFGQGIEHHIPKQTQIGEEEADFHQEAEVVAYGAGHDHEV